MVSTLKTPEGQPLEHSLLESTNNGASFQPIDAGLRVCNAGFCQYLPSNKLIEKGNKLFVNAGEGRNLLVSADRGAEWTVLSGFLDAAVCTYSTFFISGRTVLQGGECPLDRAFIDRGTLRPDKLGWINGGELKPTISPDLENRNITAIQGLGKTGLILAGAEGAVLRSFDNGLSFSYVFKKIVGGSEYPYVNRILFPSNFWRVAVISGFDKATSTPYLAVSYDDGDSWKEVSHLLPGFNSYAVVSDLAEDSQGRIIAAVTDFATRKITLVQVLP